MNEAPALLATVPRMLQFVGLDALAARAWAHLAARHPHDPEPLREVGQCLQRLGRFEEAAAVCARRTLLAGHDPEAWGALALASLQASRAQEAERALRQLARLCPDDPQPRIAVALALRRRRRTLEALRELRAAVAMPAALGPRRFLLGEAMFGADAWHQALVDWHNARRDGSAAEEPRAGRSALDSSRAAQCSAAPTPAPVAAVPAAGLAALVTVLRRTGLRRGGPEASLRLLRDGVGTLLPLPRLRAEPVARERRPRMPVAGLMLLALAAPASAAPLPHRVVLPAYETRAARDAQRACFAVLSDEAVPACERALALGLTVGKASGVARRLALLHARELRWEQAAQAWAACAAILPKEPAPRVAHGHLLSLLGRHDEALAAFDEALRLAPDDAEALLGAGTALARLGRGSEALARIDEAARREPELFERRPALAAMRDALRAGKSWP
ncbi:MAG: tetratricopeptide repeat protein [Vicinamibacteria bacterium]|nr:tetratricopeptide repeat protein [Vicinamibacteria bacterium]